MRSRMGVPAYSLSFGVVINEEYTAGTLLDVVFDPPQLGLVKEVGGEFAKEDEVVSVKRISGGWEFTCLFPTRYFRIVRGYSSKDGVDLPPLSAVEEVPDIAGFPSGAAVEQEHAVFAGDGAEDEGGLVVALTGFFFQWVDGDFHRDGEAEGIDLLVPLLNEFVRPRSF